jgi:hypothetical protein
MSFREKIYVLFLFLGGTLASLYADSVAIKNLTSTPISAAFYYVKGTSNDGGADPVERASMVVTIAAQAVGSVQRPERKTYGWRLAAYDRDIYVASNASQLTDKLTKASQPFMNVGSKTEPLIVAEANGKLMIFHDPVLVTNKTARPVSFAAYKVPGKSIDEGGESIERISAVYTVVPGATQAIERPASQMCGMKYCDRDVYVAPNSQALTQTLTKAAFPSFNIGSSEGTSFYITNLGNEIGGFSDNYSEGCTVFNKTDKDVYAAFYFVQGTSDAEGASTEEKGDAKRFGDSFRIPAQGVLRVNRPSRRCRSFGIGICKRYDDRDLYVSYTQADLKPVTPKGSLAWVNAGTIKGNEFYVAEENGKLDAYNMLAWKARPLKQIIQEVGDVALGALRAAYDNYPHKGEVARVRQGTALGAEEQAYRNARRAHVKQALEKLLGRTIADAHVPVIAFCGSGGGYRAMTSTLGFLQGAQAAGIYDAAMYNVGLSGSTWAIAGLMQSKLDLTSYIDQIKPRLALGKTDGVAWDRVALALAKKAAFGQKLGTVDLYGAILGEHLLTNLGGASNPQELFLSDQVAFVGQANVPFPLYTSIMDVTAPGDKKIGYEWVEFSPYEIGTAALGGAFVPTWAFGSPFNAGASQEILPQQMLDYLMGIWGSAFTPNMKDAITIYSKGVQDKPIIKVFNIPLPTKLVLSALDQVLVGSWAAEQRAAPATVANWMKGLSNSVAQKNDVILADAGIDFNIPFPPLLRPERAVDIIVVLDASNEVLRGGTGELRKAEQYCRAHNLKFPPIDYAQASAGNCVVFEDKNDPKCPVLIYMPLRKNPGYQKGWDPASVAFTQTSNFIYTPSDTHLITGLTAYTMQNSLETIKAVMNSVIDRKSGKVANTPMQQAAAQTAAPAKKNVAS